MKKLVTLLLTVVLCITVIGGCGNSNTAENTSVNESTETVQNSDKTKMDIKVAALKGPTSIGMVKIMQDAKEGAAKNNYEFTVAGTPDEFTANLIKGDVQIAAIPSNLAATLYNKSKGKIKIVGINTLGVLYILQNGNKTVNSVEDLRGKTIYTTGKGTTPEYTLKYLLKSAGLDADKDVTIEYKSEASEVAAVLGQTDGAIAMLPQPYVTTVTMQNKNIQNVLDVTEQWEKYAGKDSTVVTGVVAVNTDFADKNPEAVKTFIEEYKKSVEYVNKNVDQAAQLVQDFNIFKAEVAKKAIPYCNITFIEGSEMKNKVSAYLKVLYDQNPESVGGAMPEDNFY